MKKLLLLAALLVLAPCRVWAALPTYTGNLVVPTTATLTFSAGGTGCAIVTAGVVTPGICPTGTAAFTAGTNITITGTGPYTIAAPGVPSLSGTNTFSGANTFSAATTFNALPTTTVGLTNSSSSTPITSGVSGSYSAGGFRIGTGVGFTQFFTTSAAGCASQVGTTVAISYNGTTVADIDSAGNMGICGVYYSGSSRKLKFDIQPLSLNAVQVLHDTDFASFRYKSNPKEAHIGFIADDTPSILSGPHHDHFDAQALATVDALAILQLSQDVKTLFVIVGLLLGMCVYLLLAVYARR